MELFKHGNNTCVSLLLSTRKARDRAGDHQQKKEVKQGKGGNKKARFQSSPNHTVASKAVMKMR